MIKLKYKIMYNIISMLESYKLLKHFLLIREDKSSVVIYININNN